MKRINKYLCIIGFIFIIQTLNLTSSIIKFGVKDGCTIFAMFAEIIILISFIYFVVLKYKQWKK